jgi:arsenate reductase (thioredoxin)
MLNGKPSILFLSTGDATRSRMAGAFFRKLGGERYEVVSTAVNAEVSHPLASLAMREAGIDISSELSTTIAETLKLGFTCVITICDAAKERHPSSPSRHVSYTGASQIRPAPKYQPIKDYT